KAQFPEGFDNGLPSGWTTFIGENGLGTAENWIAAGTTNGYMRILWEAVTAGSVAEDWLVTPQINITTANSLLAFDQFDFNTPNYGSSLTIRISTGNSQTTHSDFITLDTQTEAQINSNARHKVDLSAYEGQSVYIAFVWSQNDGDALGIDNVNLENQNASAPDCAENPTPVIGETGATVTNGAVTISWDLPSTGDVATGYELFFGTTSGDLNSLGTFSGTSINITGSNYSTTYYWKIVLENAGGSATGCDEWSYTTENDPTLSVKNNKIEGLSLLPSIVKDDLFFTSQSTIDNISIFDMLGKQVLKFTPKNNSSSVNLTSLRQGIYLVKVSSEGKTGTYKIIKQ
ncbi:MAG: choice-of-anchor J domain-containing protein, partial [Polaribacter sp.]|nr:choice-of-anchor J domain-containing protein [Polaribacter sp.]